jgi:hypothetical protein
MPRFPIATRAWQTDDYAPSLKAEIEALCTGSLPLDHGTTQGGFVDDGNIAAIVLSSAGDDRYICSEVGVFFTEIVAGCNCGDEPESINVYCRLKLRIDRTTAEAEIVLIPD